MNKKFACAVAATLTHLSAIAAEQGGSNTDSAIDQVLPTVEVKATNDRGSASEGTGSYTTGSTSTATGLNLSIRDTPQSVSVVTRERMDDQQMKTVADALRNTIGISVKPVDRGRNTVSARGFDVNNFQFDGIPTATGNIGLETSNSALYDRVEIVRGATGLLSGAGDPSATVNLVRKHADSKVFTGDLSIELGSWNQRTATLDLSTPLNEDGSVRGRAVANFSKQDAFIDLEHTKNSLLYGVIDADLSADTRLSVGASSQVDKRNGVLWAGLPLWYADGSRTDWDRSKTTAANWNQWDTEEQNFFATLEHTFSNQWKLRGNVSYHNQDEYTRMLWLWGNPDRTTGLGMDAYPYYYGGNMEQLNFDVMATGPFSLWGRQHELTTGVMHSRQKDSWTNRDALLPVPSFPAGDFNAWDGSFPEPAAGPRYKASEGSTTQTAAYIAARLQLTDKLKFIPGARVSNWKRKEESAAWTSQDYAFGHTQVFTPYAGLIYDLTDEVSAYASYTDIFKPQTAQDRNGKYLDPLEGSNYEAGLKSELFGGKLNASAAIFRVEQDNFAVPDPGFFVPGTATPASRAAKGVTAQGYELELTGEVARGWDISAGWTQFSAKDATGADVAIDHPRRQLKLFTKYALQNSWQGLSIGGGVNWEGKTPATATNPGTGLIEDIGQPAYALIELMAAYKVSKQMSVQLNIYNLFDKKYVSRNTAWWGGAYVYGEPRKTLLTMDYKFW